jgi:hypothetical protein
MQNTAAAKLMYIKLQIYMFYILYGVGRNDFDGGKSKPGTLEGVGADSENWDFLGPEITTSEASAILAQKSLGAI